MEHQFWRSKTNLPKTESIPLSLFCGPSKMVSWAKKKCRILGGKNWPQKWTSKIRSVSDDDVLGKPWPPPFFWGWFTCFTIFYDVRRKGFSSSKRKHLSLNGHNNFQGCCSQGHSVFSSILWDDEVLFQEKGPKTWKIIMGCIKNILKLWRALAMSTTHSWFRISKSQLKTD